jgi:hypothetical protein
MADNPPLTDAVIVALALLVDDSQLAEKREPTHYDLDLLFAQANLVRGEQLGPGGRPVGKAKRIRGALNWAMINNQKGGEAFVSALISNVQGKGGFRSQSANYCGSEAIANLVAAIANNGWACLQTAIWHPESSKQWQGDSSQLLLRLTRIGRGGERWTARCWQVSERFIGGHGGPCVG